MSEDLSGCSILDASEQWFHTVLQGALGICRVCLLGAVTAGREGMAPGWCSGLFFPNHPPAEPRALVY